jgi:hypothetical protein
MQLGKDIGVPVKATVHLPFMRMLALHEAASCVACIGITPGSWRTLTRSLP